MKLKSTHIFKQFVLIVLLLQFTNISLNCSNHFNSGSSGYRHKINITSSNFEKIVDFVLENLFKIDAPDDAKNPENELLENFQLCDLIDFFETDFIFDLTKNYLPELFNSIPNYLFDLASPPPKVV